MNTVCIRWMLGPWERVPGDACDVSYRDRLLREA